jgi:thiol:disulfide interchange protein DsbD
MGFPLIGTAIWLLWVLGQQTNPMAVIATLGLLFAIAFALWAMNRWRGNLATALSIVLIAVVYTMAVKPALVAPSPKTAAADGAWEEFSTERLHELLTEGKTVFVDFTADWCLTCQVNKRVLHKPEIAEAFEAAGIVRMKADWTRGDEDITRTLKGFGRSGVPVYALYKNGADSPVLLPELLTDKIVLDYLSGK